MRWRAAAMLALVSACSLSWDDLDPRATPDPSGTSTTTSTTSTTTSASASVTTGGGGGVGGTGGQAGGGGGGGSAPKMVLTFGEHPSCDVSGVTATTTFARASRCSTTGARA